jgi:hypothetical protein
MNLVFPLNIQLHLQNEVELQLEGNSVNIMRKDDNTCHRILKTCT